MNRRQLQEMIDLKKWYDSEDKGHDTCGEYDFCGFCDKEYVAPCARAYELFIAAQSKEETVSAVAEQNTSLGKKFDYGKVLEKKSKRKSLSFAEKYALASDVVKERYAELSGALLSASENGEIKNRISKQCDTYRRNGQIVAKITIIGTSLRINLPLDPNAPEFNDGKTPHIDMGHKKVYEEVPFQFKVNSKLGLKRALVLIDLVK